MFILHVAQAYQSQRGQEALSIGQDRKQFFDRSWSYLDVDQSKLFQVKRQVNREQLGQLLYGQ